MTNGTDEQRTAEITFGIDFYPFTCYLSDKDGNQRPKAHIATKQTKKKCFEKHVNKSQAPCQGGCEQICGTDRTLDGCWTDRGA